MASYDDNSPVQYLTFHRDNASSTSLVCYASTMTSTIGVWRGESLLNYSIPLFLLQLILIVTISRAIAVVIRRFHLPRYISEIIGGFVLGPSIMGRIPNFSHVVFPLRSLVILDVFAHLGLIYFMFAIGVEMETNVVKTAGVKAYVFAAVCMVPAFTLGTISGFSIQSRLHESTNSSAFITFLGVTISLTSFSVLARTLAELKLVGTEVGRMALSSAIIIGSWGWTLLVLSIGLAQTDGDVVAGVWMMMSGIVFYYASNAVLKPIFAWVALRTPEGEEIDEMYVLILLVGVMVWAFFGDALGTHATFGAFVYGLILPNGPLGETLIEKVEDFVNGLLMPFFFVISGLRTDLNCFKNYNGAALLVVVMLVGMATKVASGVIMAVLCEMPIHDGVSLGLIMNIKGVIELVALNIGFNKLVMHSHFVHVFMAYNFTIHCHTNGVIMSVIQMVQVLGKQSFTMLVIMSVVVTAIVTPLLHTVAKPSRNIAGYKRRSIWWPNPDAELRILVCVHSPRQVPALIALLDVTHPTKRSPIFVYGIHLIEFAGRASKMLIINTAASSDPKDASVKEGSNVRSGHNRLKAQSDHIAQTFASYEQHAGGVSFQFLTAVSPYVTMYQDVVSAAECKHASLILLPFHKHYTVDGGMQADHPSIRDVNKSIIASSPCSVGILIDRRLGGRSSQHRVTQLFFGGPDDREGLALASRMAGHPSINLTIVRFVYVPKLQSVTSTGSSSMMEKVVTVMTDDDEHMRNFMARWGGGIVGYEEKAVSNAEETVAAIRDLEGEHDLFLVGRGHEADSPLMAGLEDWSEFPELGPIGDLLASSDFAASTSVLVLQQGGGFAGGNPAPAVDTASPDVRMYLNKIDNRVNRPAVSMSVLGARV